MFLEFDDILYIQETFLEQDLDKHYTFSDDFLGVGESTTHLSMGMVHGRIPGWLFFGIKNIIY